MTRKHLIILAVVAVVAAVALVVLHVELLPMNASWRTNRVLHYAWQGLAVLAAAGGGLWTLWPRPTGARKDKARMEARRRVYGLVGIVVIAVLVVVYSEVRRESLSHLVLQADAEPALKTITAALDRYKAEHAGANPKSIKDLAPNYLAAGALQYPSSYGPRADATGSAAEPSFGLATEMPGTRGNRSAADEYLIYLRPGYSWAPLTAVIDKQGQFRIVADDMVNAFEWQFSKKDE
jgi:hypothetical protein